MSRNVAFHICSLSLVLSGVLAGCDNLPDAQSPTVQAGEKVAQESKKVTAITRMCDDGDGMACADLGLRHVQGNGVWKDDSKAIDLFEKSCEKGTGVGCTYLGLAYERGRGVSQDYAKAKDLYEKGCAER